MTLFDVNVLIYAHRADQQHHAFYREFLEGLASGPQPFGLSILTAVGFVRIVTHPGFPNGPTPLPQAISVVESLAQLDYCRWLLPSRRNWEITRELCSKCSCMGKQVADAQHAAIAIEHAAEWVTRDTDFRRFEKQGLRLRLLEP